MQVINDRFGIVEGLMTTVHSITGIFPMLLFGFFVRGVIANPLTQINGSIWLCLISLHVKCVETHFKFYSVA